MSQRHKSTAKRRGTVKKQTTPIWIWAALAGIVLIALAAFIGPRLGQATANVDQAYGKALPLEISITEAAQKRANGAFILDVREPSEWQAGHIPDATLIPLGELASRVNEVPKDQQVVVVCRSGNRSAEGRDILLQAGFTQVASMAGGMNEWTAKGLPTVSGQ